MSSFKNNCIKVLSCVKPKNTFLSIKEYKNNYSEVSNYQVCFHVNYFTIVKKSLDIVKNYIPKDEIELTAKNELINSLNKSLTGYNPQYTCHDVYQDILDNNGKPIPGVKLHKEQNVIHISAKLVRKNIINKGVYPVRKSSAKTIAKRKIRSKTPLSKWVQFKLEPDKFKKLTVQNMKIEAENE